MKINNIHAFNQLEINMHQVKFYLLSLVFIAGNIIVPWFFHQFGLAGKIFLPIYFFVILAGYKYGWKLGVSVGLFSPLLNNLLTGMPPIYAIIKGVLLGFIAGEVAKETKKITLLNIVLVIALYQIAGAILEAIALSSINLAIDNLRLAIPGMLLQILFGFVMIKLLNHYEK